MGNSWCCEISGINPYRLRDQLPPQTMASLHLIAPKQQKPSDKQSSRMLLQDVGQYEGEIQNQLPHGRGQLLLKDGTYLEGQFVQGNPQGEAVVIFKNGSTYKGGVHGRSAQGQGEFKDTLNGYVYKGNWKSSKPHGKGQQIMVQKFRYQGQFLDGAKEGDGQLVTDTFSYVGQFKHNKPHGNGQIIFNSGEKYKGGWIEGLFSGHGEYHWNQGHQYKGEYLNGEKQGFGVYTRDGASFQGYWEGGVREGEGVLHADKETRGVWSKGQLINLV